MILVIGTSKGGEGKSTIATNVTSMLARRKREVILVDADPQASSYIWAQRRQELLSQEQFENHPQVDCIVLTGKIRDQLARLQTKYQYVVVDTQGRESLELVSSALVANIILMPFTIGYFSAWALKSMTEIVDNARVINENLQVFAVVNKASTNVNIHDRAELQGILNDDPTLAPLKAKLLQTVIYERRIYRTATGYGLAVEEMPMKLAKERTIKEKAHTEMLGLYKEVIDGHE
jgi:chromosome partitioning protein